MAGVEEKRRSKQRVSILNWMGTILLSFIPGVNIVAALMFIFLANTRTKRNYGIALLIVCLALLALTCVSFLVFSDYMAQLAAMIRGTTIETVMQLEGMLP